MATSSKERSDDSALNPTAPPFTMPVQPNTASNGTPPASASHPSVNGASEEQTNGEWPSGSASIPTTTDRAAQAQRETQLSGAELKKQKAAEKAARRNAKLSERPDPAPLPVPVIQAQAQGQVQAQGTPRLQRRPSAGNTPTAPTGQHRRMGSSSGRALPIRNTAAQATGALDVEKPVKEDKRVAFFSHLYSREKRPSIAGASKEIHPAVLALGFQLRDHIICGGNARCVATLLVFRKVCNPKWHKYFSRSLET